MQDLEYIEAVQLLKEAGYTEKEINELMTDIEIPTNTVIPFPNIWQEGE